MNLNMILLLKFLSENYINSWIFLIIVKKPTKKFDPDRLVLSKDEILDLPARIDLAIDFIKGFGTIGLERTMSSYNNK